MEKSSSKTAGMLALPGMERRPTPLLISASRRTDIPAYYAPWFLRRVAEGFCHTPNPFNRKQVSRISLLPQDVAGIVLWTRDPRPLLPHLGWLRQQGLDFHCMVTVTGYPREYDAGTPPPAVVAEAMRTIADSFGPERVSWRYDPILFSRQCPPAHHVEQFKYIAGMLQGATERVIVSLLEPYGKIKPRLKALVGGNWEIVTPTAAMLQETMPALQGLAREHDITMQRCAQPVSGPASLAAAGVSAGACLDAAWFQQRLGWHVDATKDHGQRAQCLCSSSRDIGMYESCPRGCVYCYAVSHFSVARRNWKAHDAAGLSLL